LNTLKKRKAKVFTCDADEPVQRVGKKKSLGTEKKSREGKRNKEFITGSA